MPVLDKFRNTFITTTYSDGSPPAQPTQITQSQVLQQLGIANPTSPQFQQQIKGNGRLQQYFNQLAAMKGLPQPFDPSLASAIVQDVLPLVAPLVAAPEAIGAATSAAGGAARATASHPKATAGLLAGIAAQITGTVDFLKFIAWIFHPRNILRAVEFTVGIILIIFGFHAALQSRGEGIEGFSTSEGALTRSGLGRVATELGRAARGRERPSRPRSAPHRTRQRALAQRYRREEDLQRRRASNPRPRKTN